MARRTVDLPAPFGRMMHAMPCGKCAQIRMVNGFSTRRTKAAIHAAATAERSGIGHVDDGGRVDAAVRWKSGTVVLLSVRRSSPSSGSNARSLVWKALRQRQCRHHSCRRPRAQSSAQACLETASRDPALSTMAATLLRSVSLGDVTTVCH
jgi:hypothetical protein